MNIEHTTQESESSNKHTVLSGDATTTTQHPRNVKQKTSHHKKVAENHSWNDIFAQSKIVVSMEPRNVENSQIMIQHAQADFLQNFGYQSSDLPMPLSALFGKATIRISIHRIQMAVLMKKSACEFVNLYKSNGIALSCHLSVISLTGCSSPQSQSDLGEETVVERPFRWAVLTIRSASVVGNSKFSGIGLLGTDRIAQDKLNEKPVTMKSKKAKTT